MAPRPTGGKRAWQRMLSGRRLDLLDPSALDVEIQDIAHGLARVARWNGQTLGDHAFSVAQHSLLVEQLCQSLRPNWPARWRLVALLHDAAEFVIGDLISPFKAAIGLDYKDLELRLLRAIHLRFSLPPVSPPAVTNLVKRADKMAAYFEATHLAGFENAEAARFFGTPKGIASPQALLETYIVPWPATQAQARFLDRFHHLATNN
ncbi:MAG: HD domain-containing protein [Alphaproteobacteria bacterium]